MSLAGARALTLEGRHAVTAYLGVGLAAGAIITLQICIMRLFAIGNWVHFGSLVVGVAMMAFGLAGAIMCIRTAIFKKYCAALASGALLCFGPLTIGSNFIAQQIPFNAIFLVSDPAQKWYLATRLFLYVLPFAAGALFLGAVFLYAQETFARVYFADLAGSGVLVPILLLGMSALSPDNLILIPILLWLGGCFAWFHAIRSQRGLVLACYAGLLTIGAHLGLPAAFDIRPLVVSDFKSVSYARNLPDANRVYASTSPFGYIEVYTSSYLHFAPGLSDNAAFNVRKFPVNVYAGLYVDGEGPLGIARSLSAEEAGYFHFLPMIYPYLIQKNANALVVQFAGGLSTTIALHSGARSVTVAEPNPAILRAFRTDPYLKAFTGGLLDDPRVRVVEDEARLHIAGVASHYDVIDLSLADSTGLSSPGGFAVVEKYSYAQQAIQIYMHALNPGGILAVTVWNREEPPKSLLKLYATVVSAARSIDTGRVAESFYVVSSYLSTATVLYKRGGFSAADIAVLRGHTAEMSFDEIYYPGIRYDADRAAGAFVTYREQIFPENALPAVRSGRAAPTREATTQSPPAIAIGQAAWQSLLTGERQRLADRYVFDTREVTNNRPYFAAYIKFADLPRVFDRLELLQDEWGYLVVWITLGLATGGGMLLVLLPIAVGWRTLFSRTRGKVGTLVFFACIGLGYIVVEVGLISYFALVLSSPTVSVSLLLPCMLVFSGLGSLASERIIDNARLKLPYILLAIAALLLAYGSVMDVVLGWIGGHAYAMRLLLCGGLVLLPAFLMGLPMSIAMRWLARLGKENMFVWGWGINGCFSVIGAALVPILATSLGLSSILTLAGCAYLIAAPAFFAVLQPNHTYR